MGAKSRLVYIRDPLATRTLIPFLLTLWHHVQHLGKLPDLGQVDHFQIVGTIPRVL